MFKCTKINKCENQQGATLLDQAWTKLTEANELFSVMTTIKDLQQKLEDQIKYKKNKDYLYTNCNRIKRRFYHYRDSNKHPRITVCILYDLKKKIACRGISLCSFKETTNKENGRDRAEDRAIEAYTTMFDSEPIVKLKALDIRSSVMNFDDEHPREMFKSAFDVELTEFEKRLFSITE